MLRLYSLAELRLAQARPREALDAALAVGEIGERTVRFLGYCPWRATAAQAALLLGERDRALELAGEAIARAERTDVLHLRIRARRVLGLCEGGTPGTAQPARRRAARLGGAAPARDDPRAGRPGRRAPAREPARRGARVARARGRPGRRGGAVALSERARVELAATGARPRREALLSAARRR